VPKAVESTSVEVNAPIEKGIDHYPENLIRSIARYDGVNELNADGSYNPIVQKFIHSVPGFEKENNTSGTPWCSCFMNYNMKEIGLKGTDNAMALSWRNWGTEIEGPVVGAVTSIALGGGSGHVNVVVGVHGNKLVLAGGNQDDKVSFVERSWSSKYRFNIPTEYYLKMKDSIDHMTKNKSWMKSLPKWTGSVSSGGNKTR
jgi:uncharacterized protein (TIGR02594 family)